MIHVLLTPPKHKTTTDNLGILHIGCLPPFAEAIFDSMMSEGWTVQMVLNPPADFPLDAPERKRGQAYMALFIVEHPELDPEGRPNPAA